MSRAEDAEPSRVGARLTALRDRDRHRAMVVAGGVLIGLGVGSVHWLGLVLGGALVALPARTFPRGLAHGIGLGALGLAVFAGQLWAEGVLVAGLSTGTVGALSVAIGLGAPVLGALVRGLG